MLLTTTNATLSWNFFHLFPYSSNTLAPTSFFSTISLIKIIDNFKISDDLYNIWNCDFVDHLSFKDSDLYCISGIYSYGYYTSSSPKNTLPLLSWFRTFHSLAKPHFLYRFYFSTSNTKLFHTIKVLKSFDHKTYSVFIIYFPFSGFYSFKLDFIKKIIVTLLQILTFSHLSSVLLTWETSIHCKSQFTMPSHHQNR